VRGGLARCHDLWGGVLMPCVLQDWNEFIASHYSYLRSYVSEPLMAPQHMDPTRDGIMTRAQMSSVVTADLA
jgi:hypothetical protein